ncbi:MAG: hypothetical protein JW943_05680 [Deltaproteobacteria bacterium]|nr:hypothetical protein [Deltaproteobacteria bacterium]
MKTNSIRRSRLMGYLFIPLVLTVFLLPGSACSEGIRITNNYHMKTPYPSWIEGQISNTCGTWQIFVGEGRTEQHDFMFCHVNVSTGSSQVMFRSGQCPVNAYCPIQAPVCTLKEGNKEFPRTVIDPYKIEYTGADGDKWFYYKWPLHFNTTGQELTKWMDLECH